MTLYELNQAGYNSLPSFTEEDFNNSINLIEKFIAKKDAFGHNYWMLLNNESRYYTLFNEKENFSAHYYFVNTLLEVIKELGEVKSIEIKEDAIEFWIVYQGECKVFYFFNYTQGVIEV